jgi:hypothetical protein
VTGGREEVGGYREEGAVVVGALTYKARLVVRSMVLVKGHQEYTPTLDVARVEIEVPLTTGRARDDVVTVGGGMIDLVAAPIGSAALSTSVFRFASGCIATWHQQVSGLFMGREKRRRRGAYWFLRMRASFPEEEPWRGLAHYSRSRSSPGGPLSERMRQDIDWADEALWVSGGEVNSQSIFEVRGRRRRG